MQKTVDNPQSKNGEAASSNEMDIDKGSTEVLLADERSDADAAKSTSIPNKPMNEKNEKLKGTNKKVRTLVPTLQMAGHTGYLTFATWPRQAQVFEAQPNTQLVVEKVQTPDPSALDAV